MKNVVKISFSILLIFMFTMSSFAQDSPTFSFRSVGLGVASYNPSLNYWNKTSLVKNWGTKFDGGVFYSFNLGVNLYRNIVLAKLEAGYWKSEAKQSAIPSELGGGSQNMTFTLIPMSGLLMVNLTPKTKFTTYIGGGMGTCKIDRKHTVSDSKTISSDKSVESRSGQDYLYYFVNGVNFPVFKKLHVGVEVRAVIGKYMQETKAGSGTYDGVSLSGPQIGITLDYVF